MPPSRAPRYTGTWVVLEGPAEQHTIYAIEGSTRVESLRGLLLQMQPHDLQSHGYSKEGGALQAAYLERATRKQSGLLRRIIDKAIVPKFTDEYSGDQGKKEFEEWKKQHKGDLVGAPSQADLIQAAMKNPCSRKDSKNLDQTTQSHDSSIDSTPSMSKESSGSSDVSSHELLEAEEIHPRWNEVYVPSEPSVVPEDPLETNNKPEDPVVNIMRPMSPQSNDMHLKRMDPELEQRLASGLATSSEIQAKYLAEVMQAKHSRRPISRSSEPLSPLSPSTTKEFTAQKLPVLTKDIEAQTGLLQADILERALHKHSSLPKKVNWLKR